MNGFVNSGLDFSLLFTSPCSAVNVVAIPDLDLQIAGE